MSEIPSSARETPAITCERRKNDFEWDSQVAPFTGSCCCCCCCLHWVGAAIGGGIGLHRGWKRGQKESQQITDSEVRGTLTGGLVIGLFAGAAIPWIASKMEDSGVYELVIVPLVLAPSLYFLPVGAAMVLAAYVLRRKRVAAFRREATLLTAQETGHPAFDFSKLTYRRPPKSAAQPAELTVFCENCWSDLGTSGRYTVCPGCGERVEQPVIGGPDHGMGIATWAAFMSILLATAGTAAGYIIMYIIFIFIQ